MTRPTTDSVDPVDTDIEEEGAPLLAATPTPTAPLAAPPPLPVGDSGSDDDGGDGPIAAGTPGGARPNLRALLRPRVVLLSLVLIFLLELAIGMTVPPINAVMESIICRQTHPEIFFPSPSPPAATSAPSAPSVAAAAAEEDAAAAAAAQQETSLRRAGVAVYSGGIALTDDPACKLPDVQGYLAMLRGWAATFDCIPGIVGALPFGILSDRWGRRPVMAMSLAGLVGSVVFTYLVFYFSDVVPLWVTWYSSAFQLFGGGVNVFVAMLFTTIADVVPAEERATVFFRLTAVFLASQMIAGPLGGAMLMWDPWFPLLVALALLVIGNLTVLAFPETVHVHGRKQEEGERHGDDGNDAPTATKLWHKARESLAELWGFVLRNKKLACLMLSLTFVILGRFVGELLLQYATARYHWSWSTASMVLTIRNAGSLVTLLALLPMVSRFCVDRFGMTAVSKDLWLGRCSGAVLILGSLVIAAAVTGPFFSVGLICYALGSGMSASVRSLLNALVEENHVGTVNSLVGFMEMVGMAMAGPLLAESLSTGLKLGGAWIGLPFVAAGLFFAVSTAILCIFRMPAARRLSWAEGLY